MEAFIQSIKEFFYKINTQLQEDFEHFFYYKTSVFNRAVKFKGKKMRDNGLIPKDSHSLVSSEDPPIGPEGQRKFSKLTTLDCWTMTFPEHS